MPSDPRERRRVITFYFTPNEEVDAWAINEEKEELAFFKRGELTDEIRDVSVAVSYERKKKEKPLCRTFLPSNTIALRPDGFLEHFDVVFAVDTNTRQINGTMRSIGAMSRLAITRREFAQSGRLKNIGFNVGMYQIFVPQPDLPVNAERFIWKYAIQHIERQYAGRANSLRIALTVDSYYDDLPAFNTREKPYFQDERLPEWLTLFYASSDSGADLLLNKLIRFCDREAGLQLDSIARGGTPTDLLTKIDRSNFSWKPASTWARFEPPQP